MNRLYIKNLIFDVFENARTLFNDYYNGKEDYTEEDFEKIKVLLESTKKDIKQLESEIN